MGAKNSARGPASSGFSSYFSCSPTGGQLIILQRLNGRTETFWRELHLEYVFHRPKLQLSDVAQFPFPVEEI